MLIVLIGDLWAFRTYAMPIKCRAIKIWTDENGQRNAFLVIGRFIKVEGLQHVLTGEMPPSPSRRVSNVAGGVQDQQHPPARV